MEQNTEVRADVKKLCEKLSALVQQNGEKVQDHLSPRWQNAARLLIDADGKDPEEIARVIDWCQANQFWRPNVMSMPTLRRHYERIIASIQREERLASK